MIPLHYILFLSMPLMDRKTTPNPGRNIMLRAYRTPFQKWVYYYDQAGGGGGATVNAWNRHFNSIQTTFAGHCGRVCQREVQASGHKQQQVMKRNENVVIVLYENPNLDYNRFILITNASRQFICFASHFVSMKHFPLYQVHPFYRHADQTRHSTLQLNMLKSTVMIKYAPLPINCIFKIITLL